MGMFWMDSDAFLLASEYCNRVICEILNEIVICFMSLRKELLWLWCKFFHFTLQYCVVHFISLVLCNFFYCHLFFCWVSRDFELGSPRCRRVKWGSSCNNLTGFVCISLNKKWSSFCFLILFQNDLDAHWNRLPELQCAQLQYGP